MDAKTDELRAAHDVLAEFYVEYLADAMDRMAVDRAVLGLFCDDAGFATVFWGGRPAEEGEGSPQGYLVARRC
jgi:hypothetical protein